MVSVLVTSLWVTAEQNHSIHRGISLLLHFLGLKSEMNFAQNLLRCFEQVRFVSVKAKRPVSDPTSRDYGMRYARPGGGPAGEVLGGPAQVGGGGSCTTRMTTRA